MRSSHRLIIFSVLICSPAVSRGAPGESWDQQRQLAAVRVTVAHDPRTIQRVRWVVTERALAPSLAPGLRRLLGRPPEKVLTDVVLSDLR